MRLVFAGLALALSLPPFPFGFLIPIPLAYLLRQGGFRAGLLAGIGFWLLHLIWLPQSFVLLFGTPLGAVPFIPLVLIKALMWAVVFGLTKNRPLSRVGGLVVLEYLTSLGTLAFPWGFFGYALVEAPGRMLASFGGVYLLSLIVLLAALLLSSKKYWVLVPWALLWVWPIPKVIPDHTALIVQGSINPLRKVMGENAEERYFGLTKEGLRQAPQADLVVWPESALFQVPAGVEVKGEELKTILSDRPLVAGVGISEAAEQGRYAFYNRVVLIERTEVLAQYDKSRLVPFGEFWPWRPVLGPVYQIFFSAFKLGNLSDSQAGKILAPLSQYGAYICYESVFPAVARGMARQGASVLVNVSNDAWFGPSFGARQHFQMGRLRAVEAGRFVLRAGNDGITASIDPYGRVVARLPQYQPGFLAAPYALVSQQTPYVRFGDWAVLLSAFLALIGLRTPAGKRIV